MRRSTGCDWHMTTTSLQSLRIRRLGASFLIGAIVAVIATWGAPAVAAPQPSQPPIEEFVPIDELPEEDRLPAAPFLIAAYSIVWILAFGYFWSLTRRFAVVERDLAGLTRRVGDGDDPERS